MAAITPTEQYGVDFAEWDARSKATLDEYIAEARALNQSERAIAAGEWPFICPYCSDQFTVADRWFPYCGSQCGINAQEDR